MPTNNGTSPEEFSRMQEEALERLREMQKRSRSMVAPSGAEAHSSGADDHSSDNAGRTSEAYNGSHQGAVHLNGGQGGGRQQERTRSTPPAGQPFPGGNILNSGFSVSEIFKSILGEAGKLDTDSLLILLMLFTLYKNKADIKLLVALGYILL